MEVFEIVPIILLMVGVILIYDARPIAKQRFSFGDQNEAAIGLKIVGFIISIIAGLLIIFL